MNRNSLLFLIILFLLGYCEFAQGGSFIPKYNNGEKIIISQGDTAFVFSVDKNADPAKTAKDRLYYYYFHQNINCTRGGFVGKPLNKLYIKHTRDGRLVEKGFFKSGLKKGKWQQWYSNGQIQSVSKWRKGLGVGKKSVFNDQGSLILQLRWKNDKWNPTRKYLLMEARAKKKEAKVLKHKIKDDANALKKAERQRIKQNILLEKKSKKAADKLKKEELSKIVKADDGSKKWFSFFGKGKAQKETTVVKPDTGSNVVEGKSWRNLWNVFGSKKKKQ